MARNDNRWGKALIALTCLVAAAVFASATNSRAANNTSLFFNVNASDPASYSTSTPTRWTDLSAAGRNGTVYGSLVYDNAAGSLTFPGLAAAYVDMGSGFNNFGTGLTIEFEGHFGASNQSWERIFDFGNGPASDNVWVGVFGESWAPNELAIELFDGGTGKGRCISTGGALTTNTFSKYVVTMDGSTCRMYKNGVELQTRVGACWSAFNCSTATTGSPYAFLPLNVVRNNNYIGKSNWSADPAFNGAIKYVRIYTSALSPTDVADNATTYTLTYSTLGSDSGSSPAARTGNGLVSLDGNTGNLVKSGNTFAGWATAAGQTTALSGAYNLIANTTLYPVWTPNTYTVTYVTNGGSAISNGSFTHGGTLTYPSPPTRSGYTFDGWFASSSGGTALTASAVAAGNASVTLQAQWTAIPAPTTTTTTTTTTTSTTTIPPTTVVVTASTVPFVTTTIARPIQSTTASAQTVVPTSVFATTTTTLAPTTTAISSNESMTRAAVEQFVGVTSNEVGEIAEVAENERGAAVLSDGVALPVKLKTTLSTVTLNYLNANLEVRCFTKDGAEIALSGDSRFAVRRGDVVRVTASGFKSNSAINVAVFSDPTALGTINTDDRGYGRQQWVVPNSISAGTHTLVAAGDLEEIDNTVFGLRVIIDQKSLVSRISSSNTARAVLILGLLIGLFIPATRRRRKDDQTIASAR